MPLFFAKMKNSKDVFSTFAVTHSKVPTEKSQLVIHSSYKVEIALSRKKSPVYFGTLNRLENQLHLHRKE